MAQAVPGSLRPRAEAQTRASAGRADPTKARHAAHRTVAPVARPGSTRRRQDGSTQTLAEAIIEFFVGRRGMSVEEATREVAAKVPAEMHDYPAPPLEVLEQMLASVPERAVQ